MTDNTCEYPNCPSTDLYYCEVDDGAYCEEHIAVIEGEKDTVTVTEGDMSVEVDAHVQELVNTGMAWRLEGHVGRVCMLAIDNGDAVLGEAGHNDYYGNYVPSRTEVKSGTKGSVEYALNRQEG